jgi:hypothetical protein
MHEKATIRPVFNTFSPDNCLRPILSSRQVALDFLSPLSISTKFFFDII